MTRKSWLISLVAAVSATACTHRTGAPTSLGQRDLQSAQGTLAAIDDVVLRWAACGGFWFVVDHTPDATMAPQHRTDALQQMAPLCRAPGTR